jgi:hypothetical protein
MKKIVGMLPQFENEKPLMKNIDKLTIKATLIYIKYDMIFTNTQSEASLKRIEDNKKSSLTSSLQY